MKPLFFIKLRANKQQFQMFISRALREHTLAVRHIHLKSLFMYRVVHTKPCRASLLQCLYLGRVTRLT